MNRSFRRVAAALFLLSLSAGMAAADATLQYETKVRIPQVATRHSTWWLTPEKVAFRSVGDDSLRIIYTTKTDALILINEARQSWSLVTRADVESLAATIEGAGAALDQEMASLTPEMRKAIEKQMGKGVGGSAAAKPAPLVEILPMTETKLINGFTCRRNDIVTDGVKSAESWNAAPGDNTVTEAEAAGFLGMTALLRTLLDSVSSFTKSVGIDVPDIPAVAKRSAGVPVYTKNLEGDAIASEATLLSLSRATISKGAFEIPKGFKEEELFPKKE